MGDPVSYAGFAIATFDNLLGTLDHLVSLAIDAGMDDNVLAARLTEDMFPLELQLRVGDQPGTARAAPGCRRRRTTRRRGLLLAGRGPYPDRRSSGTGPCDRRRRLVARR